MQKKELQIRMSYEPNRLAETYLSDAYEKIIPTIKHLINRGKKEKDYEGEKVTQSLKENVK